MSILIKGMEMPKTCYDCYFCRTYDEPNQGYFCIPLFADLHKTDFIKKRIDACPLVEVPISHGRLIDADVVYNQFLNLMDIQGAINPCQLGTILVDAPTIIESEE